MAIYDISDANDPRLPAFYDLYQRIFVLEEEWEPLDAFRKLLAFNRHRSVQSDFGPLNEQISIALEPATGAVIGLANYIQYAYPGARQTAGAFDGSCQFNFLCVDAAYRGCGVAASLLDHLDHSTMEFVAAKTGQSDPRIFITCEQNNPSRMTPEQLRADLQAAGLDPWRRLRWWAGKGYRRLDFPYQQPPLSSNVGACTYLDYYARIPGDADQQVKSIPARSLAEHLRRFFFVSVGKLAIDMSTNPQWRKQRDYLFGREEIPLLTFTESGGEPTD